MVITGPSKRMLDFQGTVTQRWEHLSLSGPELYPPPFLLLGEPAKLPRPRELGL